ncbi:MAG: serine/threonine-protein kinase [Pseudomonadota bacterium]|nr:serine/threonine-protein kinase [Pseudomonadota bacterium]
MPDLAGRYRLGEVLGTGGTSTVYRATDASLGVERAVKVLRGDGATVDAQRARLRAEARAMARVTHPNILRVYDVGTDDGQDFFVMELADGGTLQERVDAHGPLPPVLACRYALQVLGALAAAHDAGVIHRDVKPQNVLLDREGVALLADFGIALLSDGRESRHTRVGVAMGSMTYMPPEQRLDARGVAVQADLYATGATLYAILTGASPVDLFLAPVGSARWDDVAPVLQPILQRATRLVPAERFATAREMAAALVTAMAKLPPDATVNALDEAAWVGVRDRVLASLAGPILVEPPTEPTMATERPQRIRTGPAVSPTLQVDPFLPPAPRSRIGRRVAVALATSMAVGLVLVWLGARSLSAGLAPPSRVVGADVATTDGPALSGTAAGAPRRVAAAPDTGADTGTGSPSGEVGEVEAPAEAAPASPPSRPSGTSARRAAVPVAEVTAPRADPSALSPVGTWSGSFNGNAARFELTGGPAALRGTVTVQYRETAVVNKVRGTYDPETRLLELDDTVANSDSGRYAATLTPEPALEGRFTVTSDGRVVPFRLVPVQ